MLKKQRRRCQRLSLSDDSASPELFKFINFYDYIGFIADRLLAIIKASIELTDSLGGNLVKKPPRGRTKFKRQCGDLLRARQENPTWLPQQTSLCYSLYSRRRTEASIGKYRLFSEYNATVSELKTGILEIEW